MRKRKSSIKELKPNKIGFQSSMSIYKQKFSEFFTDDASVLESSGGKIKTIIGINVTTIRIIFKFSKYIELAWAINPKKVCIKQNQELILRLLYKKKANPPLLDGLFLIVIILKPFSCFQKCYKNQYYK